MFKKFTLSAVLAAVVATTASAAFAAPSHVTIPQTGAEAWQDRGNTEDMGGVYRR